MASNLKVNTILPSTGTAIGIGTASGNIDVLGHIVGNNTSNISGINSVTANTFYGSGANLTGLSGVSVANQADNRLITATGTTDALNSEANLTYDGSHLILGNGKGIRTNYIRPNGGNTNTAGNSQQYWKIGDISLNGSEGAVITLMGANGYSAGTTAAGETTIVLRGSNGNTLLGYWYSDAAGGYGTYADVRWKHVSGTNYELWVSAGSYNNIAPIVKTTGTFDTTNAAGTGSNTAPSGSTALSSGYRKRVGTVDTIEYQSTGTIFKRNISMASGYGIDFSATADGSGTMSSELLDDYEEGSFTPTYNYSGRSFSYYLQSGSYVKIGKTVHFILAIGTSSTSGSGTSGPVKIDGLPFASNARSAVAIRATNFASDPARTATVENGATFMELIKQTSTGTADMTGSSLSTSAYGNIVYAAGHYQTNS